MIDDVSQIVVRLALALAFGAVIGIEREWRQKHAGLKTMTLVALGAATFAMLSDTFGPRNANPGMLAAAVVGGIGFIGAGVIMHRAGTVQGVTTAATLWAAASVGVAIGLGHPRLATVLTIAIVVVQIMFRQAETMVVALARRDAPGRFELRVDCESDALQAVKKLVLETNLTPLRRSVQLGAEHATFRAVMRTREAADLADLEEKLVALEGVRRVDVRHLGVEDD